MNHTPGPWIADKLQDRSAYNILVPGHCAALLTLEPGKHDGASPLCRNVDADAALIAAAPDLLAALKVCESVLRIQGYVNAADIAQAAIAKATGA